MFLQLEPFATQASKATWVSSAVVLACGAQQGHACKGGRAVLCTGGRYEAAYVLSASKGGHKWFCLTLSEGPVGGGPAKCAWD